MAFDTIKWLTEDLGFTADEAKALEPQFVSRADRLEKGQLRQADYSRQMNDLKKLQDQATQNNERLNQEMVEWADTQNKNSAEAQAQAALIEQLKVEKVQLESRLTKLATDSGIDPSTVLPKPPEVKPVVPVTPPPLDPTKFIDRSEMGPLVAMLYNNPVELLAIQTDHQALFGKPLTGDEIRALGKACVDRAQKKEASDPRTVWNETFKVEEKRQQVAKDKYDSDLKTAETRGYEKGRSEAALPSPHPSGTGSPIFRNPDPAKPRTSVLQRPQAGQSTRSIAQSLREHKYAQPLVKPVGAK